MGVAVSNWRLARAVSLCGELGVVSGTFLDNLLARRLQDGDLDGSVRRAIRQFPFQDIAESVFQTYFIEGGKAKKSPYKLVPMHSLKSAPLATSLTLLANFIEVFLAKEGHEGLIGINYLTKIDLPTLPSLYGAMLAGVDYVLMGAGIPKAIPGILDKLSTGQAVSLKVDVSGASPEDCYELTFDPSDFDKAKKQKLKRPFFIAIVSSSVLAQSLSKKASGSVDGFVIEHHSAGGHNAPPRGGTTVDGKGEPKYGSKDEPDPLEFQKCGRPFWFAGSCASSEKLFAALETGAQGIQVGTAFAYCEESGISPEIKQRVIEKVLDGTAEVFTDPRASSSGYPFKVVRLEGTMSEPNEYAQRNRICDAGYLRSAYKTESGAVGFRCAAEAVDDYVRKGGKLEDCDGRKCLCNGLLATAGFAQIQANEYEELPLLTAGKDLLSIRQFFSESARSYSAAEVIASLLGRKLALKSN
jgi:nitronate monooxygenase